MYRIKFISMKKRITFRIILCLCISFPWHAHGQVSDWSAWIEDWRKAYNVPGMSVGIIDNGQVIFTDGFGILEEGKNQKADENTLYSIASNTKAFISASMATLIKEGKISWDDKVRTYLPYFELYDPCVSEMMTIRDLLCHRSGLGTFSGDVIWYRSMYTAEEVVRKAAELPNEFEFRNGYGYSNVMYLAAGEIIRAVTGKPWSQYVQEKFLTPLEMTRTITSTNDIPRTTNVASPHKPEDEGNNPIPWVNWDNMGAAGGIISSVADMTKWMMFQLHRGIVHDDTLFNAAEQRTMWTPHVNFPVGDKTREFYGNRHFNGYGLGWSTTEYFGHQMVSHTGGYDGMYSAVVMLPADQIGVVVLTNSMSGIGMNLSYEIFDKLLQLPQKDWKARGIQQDKAHWADRAGRIKERSDARDKNVQPTMTAEQIEGLYRCPMFGDIRILREGSQVYIDFVKSPDLKARLSHWHKDTYQMNWMEEQAWFEFGTVQIEQDNNGKPRALRFDVPNDDIFFEEINAVRVER